GARGADAVLGGDGHGLLGGRLALLLLLGGLRERRLAEQRAGAERDQRGGGAIALRGAEEGAPLRHGERKVPDLVVHWLVLPWGFLALCFVRFRRCRCRASPPRARAPARRG